MHVFLQVAFGAHAKRQSAIAGYSGIYGMIRAANYCPQGTVPHMGANRAF